MGEAVYIYSYPLSDLDASSGNFSSGTNTASAGLVDDVRHFQVSASVQAGHRGGPVIDSAGNVIRVVVLKPDAVRIYAAVEDLPQNINFINKNSVCLFICAVA